MPPQNAPPHLHCDTCKGRTTNTGNVLCDGEWPCCYCRDRVIECKYNGYYGEREDAPPLQGPQSDEEEEEDEDEEEEETDEEPAHRRRGPKASRGKKRQRSSSREQSRPPRKDSKGKNRRNYSSSPERRRRSRDHHYSRGRSSSWGRLSRRSRSRGRPERSRSRSHRRGRHHDRSPRQHYRSRSRDREYRRHPDPRAYGYDHQPYPSTRFPDPPPYQGHGHGYDDPRYYAGPSRRSPSPRLSRYPEPVYHRPHPSQDAGPSHRGGSSARPTGESLSPPAPRDDLAHSPPLPLAPLPQGRAHTTPPPPYSLNDLQSPVAHAHP
ncbi:hypothetical protein FRC07_005203 [Ceratobasidium sp. 392]|nr:hypothetical protein FRC07_005203 [Ceratobasidium sp. 392]